MVASTTATLHPRSRRTSALSRCLILLDGRVTRLDQQLAVAVAPDAEAEEAEPLADLDNPRPGLVEGQPARGEPGSQLRLDPLRLLLAEAARDQVIGIPCDRRAPASGIPGFAAGRDVTNARGLLQPRQSHVQQQGRYHAPNATGNFCFEVTLSYRRLERSRRVTGDE